MRGAHYLGTGRVLLLTLNGASLSANARITFSDAQMGVDTAPRYERGATVLTPSNQLALWDGTPILNIAQNIGKPPDAPRFGGNVILGGSWRPVKVKELAH